LHGLVVAGGSLGLRNSAAFSTRWPLITWISILACRSVSHCMPEQTFEWRALGYGHLKNATTEFGVAKMPQIHIAKPSYSKDSYGRNRHANRLKAR
jgi:hypothetical protein